MRGEGEMTSDGGWADEALDEALRDDAGRFSASPDPARHPTPQEWVSWFLAMPREEQERVAGRGLEASSASARCFEAAHVERVAALEARIGSLQTEVRALAADHARLVEERARDRELVAAANRRAFDEELRRSADLIREPGARYDDTPDTPDWLAGRCGVAGPSSLLPPVDGVPAAVPACVLPAGHAGWHRGNDGMCWQELGDGPLDARPSGDDCGCGHDHGQKGTQPAVCLECVWCRIDQPKTPSQLLLEASHHGRRRAGRRPWWRFWGA